jgi:hypothetical protein
MRATPNVVRASIAEGWSRIPSRFKMKEEGDERGLGSGGGGLGLARLHDGTTLLIVSAPGGGFRPHTRDVASDDNARARYPRLYRFVPGVFATDAKSSLLGEWPHPGVSSKPDGPGPYSENLSVVTECGSGNIYTIHTTGEYGLKGNGYWRLSRGRGNARSSAACTRGDLTPVAGQRIVPPPQLRHGACEQGGGARVPVFGACRHQVASEREGRFQRGHTVRADSPSTRSALRARVESGCFGNIVVEF